MGTASRFIKLNQRIAFWALNLFHKTPHFQFLRGYYNIVKSFYPLIIYDKIQISEVNK